MQSPEMRDQVVHDILGVIDTTGQTLNALHVGLFRMFNSKEEYERMHNRLSQLAKESVEGCNEVIRWLGGIPILSSAGQASRSLVMIDAFTRKNDGSEWDIRCREMPNQAVFESRVSTDRIREIYVSGLSQDAFFKQLQTPHWINQRGNAVQRDSTQPAGDPQGITMDLERLRPEH